jgi:CheY-like chemotaxis protein
VLGHAIELRSAPGRGSCFAVRAPRTTPPHTSPSPAAGIARGPVAISAVLVVDDDCAVRQATLELLSHWGCDARGVDGLTAARDELRKHGFRPDFVLADFHLRGADSGLSVIAALRELAGPQLRAALLTAEADPKRLAELRASGLPVLAKPLRPAQLRALLSSP